MSFAMAEGSGGGSQAAADGGANGHAVCQKVERDAHDDACDSPNRGTDGDAKSWGGRLCAIVVVFCHNAVS